VTLYQPPNDFPPNPGDDEDCDVDPELNDETARAPKIAEALPALPAAVPAA